jgi:predicted nuclease with RNAse H fold
MSCSTEPILATLGHSAPPERRTRVAGVDLRSGPRYPTGYAVLDGNRRVLELRTLRTDEQLLAAIEASAPDLVAIDAPLALPEGRCCAKVTCPCASFGLMREVDRVCAALGYRPFPTLLPSMVGLTLRGIELLAALTSAGVPVVEVYPGMAQDRLGVPRKRQGLEGLRRGLFRAGVRGMPRARRVSHDELDAVTCALVGVLHLDGRAEAIGPGVPVPLIAPRVHNEDADHERGETQGVQSAHGDGTRRPGPPRQARLRA